MEGEEAKIAGVTGSTVWRELDVERETLRRAADAAGEGGGRELLNTSWS